MDKKYILDILERVRTGEMTTEQAVSDLTDLPFEDLDFAKIDNHRGIRTGYPEIVFCQGKTPERTAEIMAHLWQNEQRVIGTRASEADFEKVRELLPEARYHAEARMITAIKDGAEPNNSHGRKIAVLTAGTSDIPIAEEAAVTAEALGNEVMRIYDVGVAGIHRLFARLDDIRSANAVICVAGMEGALASVVGGLVDAPVVAVPTSIGYGSNFGGLSALLSMLNSCANGVAIVNIDNGFGAGYLASMMNRDRK